MRFIFYFVCFLIAYGSLFPFDFSNNIDSADFLSFFNSWNGQTSIGDVLGNVILFMPYGFLGLVAFSKSKASVALIAILSVLGVVLAFVCQVAQLYLLSRSPALVDVYWNILGLLLGIIFAYSYRVRTFVNSVELYSFSFPLVLLGLWVASRLVPFVPSIDLQAYKNALKPLLVEPEFDFYEFVFLSAAWLVAAHLFFYLCRIRAKFLLLIAGVTAVSLLEIVIVKNDLSVTDVMSSLFALFLWPLLPKSLTERSLYLLLMLLIGTVSVSLFPFEWVSNDASFGWIPFTGFLSGSMLVSSGVFAQKLFVIGALFFLLHESGWFSFKAIAFVFAIFLSIEILQMWINGHSAEITDPILVLLCGLFFFRISDVYLKKTITIHGSQSSVVKSSQPVEIVSRASISDFRRRCLVVLSGGVVAVSIMAVFYSVVRLPGVPYNVRELFWLQGSGPDLFFLSLALLLFGLGAAWIGHAISLSKKPIVIAPLAAITVSILFYLCLFMSVTPESISDIGGSSVWVQRLEVAGVLGQPGMDFVRYFGTDNLRSLTNPVEPIVRIGVLFGPVLILFSVFFAALFKTRWLLLPQRKKGILRYFLIYLGCMLPWLAICKVIAFDLSSTDNLTELVAIDGPWMIGGGGYLYLLVFTVIFSAVMLSISFINATSIKIISACVLSIVLVPVGWFFLNEGLVGNVDKYGLNYSGVDFLLGPDRINLLSTNMLFFRWFVVQLSAVIVLATGALLYLLWVGVSFLPKNQAALPKRNLPSTYYVEVNLSSSQINFLNELSSAQKQSFSATVRAIIDKPLAEKSIASFDHCEIVQSASSEPISYSRMKACHVRLDPNQFNELDVLAGKFNMSRSKVIRDIVEHFILSCS